MKKSNLKKGRKRSEMSEAERVQALQRKLYLKAKQEAGFRFYAMYDKVSLGYVLRESYRRVKANGGSPGADGMTFEQVEGQIGRKAFLSQLEKELKQRTCRPSAVKRVMITHPRREETEGRHPTGGSNLPVTGEHLPEFT